MKKRLFDAAPIFVCSILVLGISELIFKLYNISIPYYTIFLWALIFILSLYVLLINKKTAIISLSIIVLGLVVIYIFLKPEKQESVLRFFYDSYNFLTHKTQTAPQSQNILGAIFVLVMSIVFIIPSILHPNYLIIVLLSSIPVFLVWQNGKPDSLADTLIIIGALTCFFAVKNKSKDSETRNITGAVTLFLIPAATIIMLLVYSIASEYSLTRKSEWLEIRKDTIGDFISEATGHSSPRSVYDLSSVGYAPLDGRLGGPVNIDNDKVLQIKSNYADTYLLRGNIKNTYTGYTWIDDTVSYRSRMNSRNKHEQTEVFNLYLPDESLKTGLYFKEVELFITPLSNSSATIFAPNRVINVKPEKALTMLVSYNTEGEVFAARGIKRNLSYEVTAEHIKYNIESFGRYIESIQSDPSYTDYASDELFAEYYMSPFESVPDNIWSLAAFITEGANTDYMKATLIKEYLEDGFTYTLSPEIPPENIDFVSHFLETKRGYCTYYASAMAVLSRCAGLPSRYVEGFKADIVTANKQVTLTNANAHAWAEIYIAGIGWLPFDPETSEERQSAASTTSTSVLDDFIPETTPAPLTEVETEYTEDKNLLPLIIIVFAFVLLILAFCAVFLLSQFKTSYSHVTKKDPSANGIALFYFSEIMILFSYMKYRKPIGFTLSKYAKGVDSKIRVYGQSFKDIVLIINKLLYSKSEISKDEVLFIYNYYISLKAFIKKQYGIIRYLYITISMMLRSHRKAD